MNASRTASKSSTLDVSTVWMTSQNESVPSSSAAWLAQMTGQPRRLATEAEWEKAARWDPALRHARIYPWGDAFENERCHIFTGFDGDNDAEQTVEVGRFSRGASPCGAQYMAGNVWEWTSSLHKPYPYVAGDGREDPDSTELRVLRGGAWSSDPPDARTATRSDGTFPDGYLGSDIGFRVVCAGHSSL